MSGRRARADAGRQGLLVRVQLAAPATAQVYTIDLSTVRSTSGRRVLGDKVYYTVVVPR